MQQVLLNKIYEKWEWFDPLIRILSSNQSGSTKVAYNWLAFKKEKGLQFYIFSYLLALKKLQFFFLLTQAVVSMKD
jgi:hypothetical protein